MTSCANGPKQADNMDLRQIPWQEISPEEIDLNPVQMIDGDWLEVSAGKKGDMNLMTISWGTIGELWSKPVFIVYVSTSRYTHRFMEENDCFTVTHFPASMRPQLSYLGRVSGRDEDKLANAGVKPLYIDGTAAIDGPKLIFVCRKLYVAPLDVNAFVDKSIPAKDYASGDIHTMYVGEIIKAYTE